VNKQAMEQGEPLTKKDYQQPKLELFRNIRTVTAVS
jgi:hypothetical protein